MHAAQKLATKAPCKSHRHGARAVGQKLSEEEQTLVRRAFEMQQPPYSATLAVSILAGWNLLISVTTACKYGAIMGFPTGGQGRRIGSVDDKPRQQWSRIRKDILALYASGQTVAAICRSLGCSRALVHRYLKQARVIEK